MPTTRRIPAAWMIAALLSGLLAVAPAADAGHNGAGCSDDWSGRNSCQFFLRGLPIEVFGDALVSSGTASLRIWVTFEDDPRAEPVLECSASGAGYARCDNEIGAGVAVDPRIFLRPMRCHVEGRGSGYFTCLSGLGT